VGMTKWGKRKCVSINSLRSYLGSQVNLHLSDGSVVVNVFLESIMASRRLRCRGAGGRVQFVRVADVVEVRPRPLQFMQEAL
jgi:hypothetical protein